MSNVNISFNSNGITTAQVILVLREKADLGTIVFQQAFTANSQHNYTVLDLNPVMHQVEIWDTNDGTTLNALKGQCDVDAAQSSSGASGSFSYIQFVTGSGIVTGSTTGVCPTDGAAQYVDAGLNNANYIVNKEGFGILQWGRDIDQISGGGFKYINGAVFSGGESYTIIVSNASTIPSSPSSSVAEYNDIVVQTTNITLNSGDRNKLHVFNFSGNVAVITMESLSGVPDKTVWGFNTHRGNQINGEISFQSGQGCYFMGSLRNKIYLGKNEEIKIQVKGGVAYCTHYDGDYANVGMRVYDDIANRANRARQNGTEYDGTVYKRWFDFVQNLPSGQKKTYAEWDDLDADNIQFNNGFYAVNGTNFKVPNMTDLGMYKSTNNLRTVGDYEKWQVGSHFHASGTETDDVAAFQRAASHLARNWNTGNTDSAGTDSTDLNVAAGTENRVRNVSQYCMIII